MYIQVTLDNCTESHIAKLIQLTAEQSWELFSMAYCRGNFSAVLVCDHFGLDEVEKLVGSKVGAVACSQLTI